ncbi:thiamine phosphate synthase [Oxynema aestuarii]|jgi:thiamine-phosphate pyrophosphorylase|uniref:Thiamine-phosphate synthase n=1 Tax=Oxynema aestuarii AP17 TaxID=2064643 RepID=A0A6H1TTM8_9CYAN|nr:thiamine phosphate synthase [Oxynema aestuarii]QIZ69942.1 thiamine phosphate synthase [Oxynema aestuarii AP17]RMH79147.1 MAG: thiamine phosphate synthase [Cyanobacteria bacterium J007]
MSDKDSGLEKQSALVSLKAQPAVRRILDANLDRAREGLRIIEEWCRFGLESQSLASECKQLRQELGSWHSPELRSARNTSGDPGTSLTHEQEEERDNLADVLTANFCRIEEALRVLEEYGKIYNRQMGASFKQMRYRVYQLESALLAYERQQLLKQARLYLVTSPSENIYAIVEAALQGGLTLVQYRDKDSNDCDRLRMAQKLCRLCHDYKALFIINDRVDLALAVEADGVHLGQQDVPLALARELLGPHRIIGRSTTNSEELQRALLEGADYIGVGPVYQTPTKAGKTPAGLDYVRYAAENSPIPWFAIGGIDMSNLNEVISGGAERVAVVRAICDAEQPTLVTQYFLSQLNRIDTLRAYQQRHSQSHGRSNYLAT